MSAVAFDTLKFARRLEAGGFTSDQASAAAEAFADATSQELATKRDLNEVEARLGAKIETLELRMTIKLGGLIVVATGILLTALRYLPATHP